MKSGKLNEQAKSSFEMIEEAVHLLRLSPRRLTAYYVGTLPFVLALLYFWADMSRSPFAELHLGEAGLGLATLFIWMKSWQAVFTSQVLDALTGNTTARPWRHWARVVISQTTLQPSGLFLVPLASIPLVPFAWFYAFYQNVTVLGADDLGVRALCRRATRQSALLPKQNHLLLSVLFGFGLFVFLNWATVILVLPLALKTLLGIQSTVSRSPLTMLNTTYLAVVAGLTHLSVDPLIKAVYTLRCFYGEARQSGADLRADLTRFCQPAAVLVALILFSSISSVQGQEASPTPPAVSAAVGQASGIEPQKLDRAITEVLRERKYSWRSPREKLVQPSRDQDRGILGRFLDGISAEVKKWGKGVAEWLDRVLRKLFRQSPPTPRQPLDFSWVTRLHLLIYFIAAAALIGVAFLVRRVLKDRRARQAPVSAEAIKPTVDVADENVAPDQLPEDGWSQLAREYLERGELRLALRALYLASLAHLAGRNLVTIARFKSNRDYERELVRRAHSFPDLLDRFSENVTVFDRIWYGMHPVDSSLLSAFAANVEGIRTGA